jgi:hypothetical protein
MIPHIILFPHSGSQEKGEIPFWPSKKLALSFWPLKKLNFLLTINFILHFLLTTSVSFMTNGVKYEKK